MHATEDILDSILRLSLEEGISGTGQIGRGIGLYYLSRLVQETGGECLIASDRGTVVQSGSQFFEKSLSQDTKGSVVVLKMTNKELGL